jgi:hypothetical protein
MRAIQEKTTTARLRKDAPETLLRKKGRTAGKDATKEQTAAGFSKGLPVSGRRGARSEGDARVRKTDAAVRGSEAGWRQEPRTDRAGAIRNAEDVRKRRKCEMRRMRKFCIEKPIANGR